MNKLSHRYSGYHSTFSTENVADLFFILFEYLCIRLIHMLETWFDSDEKPHLKVNQMLSFSIVCHKPDSSMAPVYRRVSDIRFTRLSQSLADTSIHNLISECPNPNIIFESDRTSGIESFPCPPNSSLVSLGRPWDLVDRETSWISGPEQMSTRTGEKMWRTEDP